MKKYADKTSAERSIERWEGEDGEVLPTALRNKEIAEIEMRQDKSGELMNPANSVSIRFAAEEVGENAPVHGEVSFGQGERGTKGYGNANSSEISNFGDGQAFRDAADNSENESATEK